MPHIKPMKSDTSGGWTWPRYSLKAPWWFLLLLLLLLAPRWFWCPVRVHTTSTRFQNVILRPAASVSPANLLEMCILQPTPDSPPYWIGNSEVRSSSSHSGEPTRGFWCTLKVENNCCARCRLINNHWVGSLKYSPWGLRGMRYFPE